MNQTFQLSAASRHFRLPTIPLVRAAFSQPFRQTLSRIGCPWEDHLSKLGVPRYMDFTPYSLIPERPWWQLVDHLATKEGIPDLGLLIGGAVSFDNIESFKPYFQRSSTLAELLTALCEFTPTQSSHDRFELLRAPDSVWLRSVGPCLVEGEERPVQIPLYHLLGFIQVVQLAVGESWRPRVIELPFAYHRAIEQSPVLGAESVRFDSKYPAIEIPASLLSTPIIHQSAPNAAVNGAADGHSISNVARDFGGSLREVLLSCLSIEPCRLENIAALCGLPVRTLQRRLAEQGVSYTQVLDETRQLEATRLIQQTDLPLTEVAFLLGYSDYPKFSRAFQRWFQHTPRQFRINEQQELPA